MENTVCARKRTKKKAPNNNDNVKYSHDWHNFKYNEKKKKILLLTFISPYFIILDSFMNLWPIFIFPVSFL